jgi:maleate cis-trans isomerase
VGTWACSSCSFTRGLDGAREQARVLAGHLGVPASSTSLAYLAALGQLGVDRVALASVYRPDLTARFAAFLAEAGVTTVHAVSADGGSDRALAAWDGQRITDLAVAADHEDAGAVLVPETALHTTPLLARAGSAPVRDGLGALFSAGAGRRPSSSAS